MHALLTGTQQSGSASRADARQRFGVSSAVLCIAGLWTGRELACATKSMRQKRQLSERRGNHRCCGSDS